MAYPYHTRVYITNIKPSAHNDNNQPNNDTIEVPPILQSEVKIAVEELKNGKTPGEDHIHNEYLKVGLEQLQKQLTEMFNVPTNRRSTKPVENKQDHIDT